MSGSDMKWFLSVVDAPRRQIPVLNEQEQARRFAVGHRYNVEMSRRHNRESWNLQLKLDLKNQAIQALPPNQLDHALKVKETLPHPAPSLTGCAPSLARSPRRTSSFLSTSASRPLPPQSKASIRRNTWMRKTDLTDRHCITPGC